MLISIIIPVYNVELYLIQCLKSVSDQTYKNFEVILIDDGSTDNSSEICDEWVNKDKRFSVIHKKNGGLMAAWIDGIKACNGEYIVFVDSDDWLDLKFIEKFIEIWKQYNDIDLIVGNFLKDSQEHKEFIGHFFELGYYDKAKILSDIYPKLLNNGKFQGRGINPSRWGKLIKKSLILKNLEYCDTRISYGEDLNILFPIFLDCKSLFLLDNKEALYHYRINPESILQSYNPFMLEQIFLLYKQLYYVCDKKESMEFISQIKADYIAAIVQYYKNELLSKKTCFEIIKLMRSLKKEAKVDELASQIKWKTYPRLNRLIISIIISDFEVYQIVCTSVLKILKKKRYRKKVKERILVIRANKSVSVVKGEK